jgi:predicted nucleic acid-binding Zn ribbon protein
MSIISDSPSGEVFTRPCLHCGKLFSPLNRNEKRCSDLCKSRAKEIRRKAAKRFYWRKGRVYVHRLVYVWFFGFFGLPEGWHVHHISGYSNNPFNLVALPSDIHCTVTHIQKRGEDASEILAPFLLFREICYLRQSIIQGRVYPAFIAQSTRKEGVA